LDLYRGRYDFKNFSTQVHDFDPGIHPYPGGLFWTQTGVSVSGIEVGAGRARMSASELPETDFGSIPNALFRFAPPVSTDAAVTFDIHWSGPVTSRGKVTQTPGSSGELFMCKADMTWSAHESTGFRFVSNPNGTTSAFAQLGHIRNGVFSGQD
jgi:hypothetical protein